ncbi:MAG: T9SS C-terminal target domain-containing protein [Calditrichaeota bacterium]|nr:MAG: T9SS C-terminal target domain-containing protein [Calditrichota bacterium]
MEKVMKNSITIFVLLLSLSNLFGINVPPQTYKELEKELRNSENVLIKFNDLKENQTRVIYGFKETLGEPTLFQATIGHNPLIEWETLSKNDAHFFDLPVEEILLSERFENTIYVLSKEGIFFSRDGGNFFQKSEMPKPKSVLEFQESVKEIENSLEFLNFDSNKYTNQIYDLPPDAPTVWDTILWDTTQVLLTNNVLPGGAYMHGRVAVGDSGLVHVITVKEDDLLRYFRSTDYGVTFELEVVLEDTIPGVYRIISTGDFVYVYAIESIFHPNPKLQLLVSPDKGANWNPVIEYSFATHSNISAIEDTVYDYQESPSQGGGFQAISYNSGQSFSPYSLIGGPFLASIQRPTISIGGNSILYFRTGSDSTVTSIYAYRSFNKGNNWLPQHLVTPIDIDTQFPHSWYDEGAFHLVQNGGGVVYNRSDDFGNTFTSHITLCSGIPDCHADVGQRVSSKGNNVFTLWQDEINYPEDRLMLRFSRDNGYNWSQPSLVSEIDPLFIGIDREISISVKDSLIYSVFTSIDGASGDIKLNLRRGFYHYGLFSSSHKSINYGLTPSNIAIDTSITITNQGNRNLEMNQFDFPPEFSSQSQLPITIQPDSSFTFDLSFNSSNLGFFNKTLFIHTSEPVVPIKEINVTGLIVVSVEEENNLIDGFQLSQNYPNPFNPTTLINYELPITNYENAKLTIFNILGEKVKEFDLLETKGSVVWNGTNSIGKQVSSGIYFYRLKSGESQLTKKMLLLR